MRALLAAGEFEELPEGGFRVAGHELGPDEVLVERRGREGWEVVSDDAGLTVALDASLDDELRVEGQVLDLIRQLRRAQGGRAQLTDRITVTLPEDARTCSHEDWIKRGARRRDRDGRRRRRTDDREGLDCRFEGHVRRPLGAARAAMKPSAGSRPARHRQLGRRLIQPRPQLETTDAWAAARSRDTDPGDWGAEGGGLPPNYVKSYGEGRPRK